MDKRCAQCFTKAHFNDDVPDLNVQFELLKECCPGIVEVLRQLNPDTNLARVCPVLLGASYQACSNGQEPNCKICWDRALLED